MTIGQSNYHEKREARIERMRERAAGKRDESATAYRTFKAISDVIPLGQPILVGHHSEKRHRRDIARIDTAVRRSVEAEKEAARLDSRASAAERNDAISSDNPEALELLRVKVAKLESAQDFMKRANRAIRKHKTPEALSAALNVSPEDAAKLLTPDCFRGIGYPDYKLKNNNANIRRIKQRIAQLEREDARKPAEPQTFGDIELSEEDNRVRLTFPSKPNEAARTLLRSYGFVWSPTAGTWQRKANDSARHWAAVIAAKLATDGWR